MRTENPIGGCEYGCRWEMPDGHMAVCYAEDTAERGVAAAVYPHGFAHHYWRGEKGLKSLIAGREPDLIFPDSMSDMFGHWVPENELSTVLEWMGRAAHHAYQALSKSAPQFARYLDRMPPNLWVGHSSPPDFMKGKRMNRSQQQRFLKLTLSALRTVRERTGNLVWMSLEPVSWDMADEIGGDHPLDWVVIGAASSGRTYYQPEAEHIEKLLAIFDATNTPVFFKGNIRPLIDQMGGRWREDFPATYRDGSPIPAVRRRQEMARQHGWTLNTFLSEGTSTVSQVYPAVTQAQEVAARQMSFFD